MLTVAVAVLILIGLVGTVLPIVPGLVLIWAAIAAWAWLAGGGWTRWAVVAVCAVLAIVGNVLAAVLPGRHVVAAEPSVWVMLAGTVGMVVGFFVLPVVGLVVGAALGIFLAELVRAHDVRGAWQLTLATLRGFGVAALAQFGVGIAMAVLWAAAVVFV